MQLALKVGKPWGTNFPNHILSGHFFAQQPMKMYNLIGSARPWHYPLQHYTALGEFNASSTLLKVIFYQVTYMATIFSKVCMVYPWDLQVVMSLTHFQLDGYNFQTSKDFS